MSWEAVPRCPFSARQVCGGDAQLLLAACPAARGGQASSPPCQQAGVSSPNSWAPISQGPDALPGGGAPGTPVSLGGPGIPAPHGGLSVAGASALGRGGGAAERRRAPRVPTKAGECRPGWTSGRARLTGPRPGFQAGASRRRGVFPESQTPGDPETQATQERPAAGTEAARPALGGRRGLGGLPGVPASGPWPPAQPQGQARRRRHSASAAARLSAAPRTASIRPGPADPTPRRRERAAAPSPQLVLLRKRSEGLSRRGSLV